MKTFNTTAVCIPEKHYMVDIADKVQQITGLVDAGKYFTINRARQYGKTTTITELAHSLAGKYTVLSLDFQGISAAGYATEGDFIQSISRKILDKVEFSSFQIPEKIIDEFNGFRAADAKTLRLDEL